MKKYQKEIIGIYLFFISIFLLLSLFSYDVIDSKNLMGPVGYYIADKLVLYFGFISYSFPIILLIYGYCYFMKKDNATEHQRYGVRQSARTQLSIDSADPGLGAPAPGGRETRSGPGKRRRQGFDPSREMG